MSDRYLIIGLGNPGREYENTRHNVGFRCLEAFAAKHGALFGQKQARARIADGTFCDRRFTLAMPQTYMNLSGESVGSLVNFYKVPFDKLIIVADDLDTPFGSLRLRMKGSAGGQNGLKSIIQHLGTQDFARVRFGIGRPPGKMNGADYVLGAFPKADEPLVLEMVNRTVKALETWLCEGIEMAMTRYNGETDPLDKTAVKPPKPKEVRPAKPPTLPTPGTAEPVITPTPPDSAQN
jgi:PTH1 family peptidyl-tRNA hydrolase